MENPKNGGAAPRKARGRPRDWGEGERNIVKSLDRALAILDHLSDRSGLPLSQIAADLGQSPATVYRVLLTLEARGLAEFDRGEQLWHIGARAFVIGARFLRRTSLVDRARPIMRVLMERTGETANLGIFQGDAVLFVNQVETHANIRAFFPPGTLSPLHASGIGKALLAEMSPGRLERALRAAGLPRFTDKTLADAGALGRDLALTRARGHAIDDEETSPGMRCIAAPVFDVHGEAVAGISVSGPTSRITPEKTAPLAAHVMRAAAELTAAIGGAALRRPPA